MQDTQILSLASLFVLLASLFIYVAKEQYFKCDLKHLYIIYIMILFQKQKNVQDIYRY